MSSLDRLGWAAGLAFTGFGVRMGIRATDDGGLLRLAGQLPRAWRSIDQDVVDELYSVVSGGDTPKSAIRRYHLLYYGSTRLVRTLDVAELEQSFGAHLAVQTSLAAERHLFVRAGVVGWGGRALLVLGPHAGGTTTLVRALLERGATYYSDQYAVIDLRGRVHPYATALSWREGDGGAGATATHRASAESLGAKAGRATIPVGLIVTTRFEAGAVWRPQALPPGRALLALLERTPMAGIRPSFSMEVLQPIASRVPIWRGKRGEANEVADAVLRRFERLVVPP